MIILQSEELDYDDVLLLPNRSKTISRKDVNVVREFQFYHSNRMWVGTPIFAANMSSVGTFRMGKALAEHNMCTAIHKHCLVEELIQYFAEYSPYLWYTTGIRGEDLEKLKKIRDVSAPNIVIDVPNGYTDDFVSKCMNIRNLFPESIIMAGNVCTGEMVQELILHGGVDIVKVGIGPGCFVAGTKVQTSRGKINIENIKPGDNVLTHTGEYKEVTNTLSRIESKRLYTINNVVCTGNHEFYVIHKSIVQDDMTDEFIENNAKWVSAEELSDDYFLISVNT